jgi:hypothetical protein
MKVSLVGEFGDICEVGEGVHLPEADTHAGELEAHEVVVPVVGGVLG